MTAEGFLNQKQRHPVAMAAAVSINLAAVIALMLAKSDWVPPVPTVIWARHIPLDKPVEPERRPEQRQANAERDVYVPPKPSSDDKTIDEPVMDGTDVLKADDGRAGGNGTAEARPEPTPTTTPLPVLTEAVPLASAMREFQPPYPPQLLRTGVEGKAVVRVLIGTDGRVKQVAIISADDSLFADATERQAKKKWRFKPATRDGVAVETWKQMTVRFEIRS